MVHVGCSWCYSESIFTLGKLKNVPDHGENRTQDLWNVSPMLSYAVGSVGNRGYYTAMQRCQFYLRVVKQTFISSIKFISSNRCVICCLLCSHKHCKTQVSNFNFRSVMLKTWLYFNQLHILFKQAEYLYVIFVFSCIISIFFDTNI